MTDQIERRDPELKLAPRDRLALSRAMTLDHEAFLAPGERFAVDAEVGASEEGKPPGYIWAQVLLGAPDDSFRLDLEVAITPQDQPPTITFPESEAGIALLLDFLRVQLYEFFRQDRQALFHDDWRLGEFQGIALRFRGSIRRPDLEAAADALLDDNDATTPQSS